MTDYIQGRARPQAAVQGDLFGTARERRALVFSPEARAAMDAGRALWRYYHAQPGALADAALYDIRLHFQGTDGKGRMNAGSGDARYTELMAALRSALKALARKIEPKVYTYGFLVQ